MANPAPAPAVYQPTRAPGPVNYNADVTDGGNMPAYPNYNPSYDPNTMSMAPQVASALSQINPNTQGLDMYRQQATRTGPSAWATLANQQQNLQEQNTRERAGREMAGQTAQGEANLASNGGLTSGARERLAQSGQKGFMDVSQDASRQGGLNRLQVGINDEQNRINQLGQLPGMENQLAQFNLQKQTDQTQANQYDITNQMNANNAQNQFNMGLYQTAATTAAANNTSNATLAAGNAHGSWLCTEANHSLTKKDWVALAKLRRYSFRRDKAVTSFYIYGCAPLIARMRKGGANWAENQAFVRKIITLVNSGEMLKAHDLYFKHTKKLIKEFWADCIDPVFLASKEMA